MRVNGCRMSNSQSIPVGGRRRIIVGLSVLLLAMAVTLFVMYRQLTKLENRLDETRLNPLTLNADALLFGGAKQFAPVVLIGDSRAQMWTRFPQVTDRGVSRNFGVSGHTTGQVLARYVLEIKPTKPEVIVVVAGVNDLGIPSESADHRREIEKDAERNLRRLVTLAREDGTQVIITTIFGIGELPLRRLLDWPTDFEANRAQLNQSIRGLAGPGVHVLDAESVLQPSDKVDPEVLADFIHLNTEGYTRLNRQIEPVLRKLLVQPITNP